MKEASRWPRKSKDPDALMFSLNRLSRSMGSPASAAKFECCGASPCLSILPSSGGSLVFNFITPNSGTHDD